jgi:hypothetical protein
MWVAGGSPGATGESLCYSYDGISWTASTNGNSIFTTYCSSVASNGSRWVATGVGTNQLAYSDDGITWTGLGNSFFSLFGQAVVWNGSYWLAGGGSNASPVSGQILYSSTDGITWTAVSTPGGIWASIFSLAWNGSIWVAGGLAPSGTTKPLGYSYDGITWTQTPSSTPFNNLITDVVWGQSTGYFVASGRFVPNEVAYSADGINWTGSSSGNSLFAFYPALSSNPEVIIGVAGSTLGYTNDGTTWSSISQTGLGSSIAIASN